MASFRISEQWPYSAALYSYSIFPSCKVLISHASCIPGQCTVIKSPLIQIFLCCLEHFIQHCAQKLPTSLETISSRKDLYPTLHRNSFAFEEYLSLIRLDEMMFLHKQCRYVYPFAKFKINSFSSLNAFIPDDTFRVCFPSMRKEMQKY